ncbi:hypothetical protein [Bacillus sp. JJ722]|uniref:hypothetical protein n=1 Tax=Bacillus sp. JJ722 TaxID=3122973 RepID=UPI002FFFE81C
MNLEEKSNKELFEMWKKLNKKSGFKLRKLKQNEKGEILLDSSNPQDVEWFNNDEEYDYTKE